MIYTIDLQLSFKWRFRVHARNRASAIAQLKWFHESDLRWSEGEDYGISFWGMAEGQPL